MTFYQISLKSLLLQFPMDSSETICSYSLGQSSNIVLFSEFLKFPILYFFFYQFSSTHFKGAQRVSFRGNISAERVATQPSIDGW